MKKQVAKCIAIKILNWFILLIVMSILFRVKDIIPIFFNNDDIFLNQLVSGEYTGNPESHLVHIGYLSSLFISFLYGVMPTVPWYGLYLFGLTYCSIILAISPLYQYFDKKIYKVFFAIISMLVVYGFLFLHLLQIQFTTVTAFVCAASLVRFLCVKDQTDVKSYICNQIPSIILFCVSFELRSNACIMFLPIFFLLGISKVIRDRKMWRAILSYCCVLVGILIILGGIDKVAYHNESWQEFIKFSENRASMEDYGGYPKYEDNQNVYEELGISYESYKAMATRQLLLLDDNINANSMELLANARQNDEKSVSAMIKTFWDRHIVSYEDRPLNMIVYVFYLCVVLMIIISRKYRVLYDVAAVFVGRMIIWMYLLYIGRLVSRVTQGVYVVELLLLLSIFCYAKLWENKDKKKSKVMVIGSVFSIIIVLVVSLKWGVSYTERIIINNNWQLLNLQTHDEIFNYFDENSDNVYLLDVNSFSYFSRKVFSVNYSGEAVNKVLLGCWMSKSPWTDKIADKFAISSYEKAAMENSNIYFVFMDTEGTSYAYLTEYYSQKYPGITIEVQDVFETSTGVRYLILKCIE